MYMCLLIKNVYSYAKKKNINVRVFTSEECILTLEDKCICSCINIHVYNSKKSLFTC
jgi:hypothetical protein